jgi:hypothetical protein
VREKLASFWWAKVFAWRGSARPGTASLLDAQGATFNDLTLKTFLGSVGLLSSDHLHETEATGLLGMGIKHDLALLDIAIFLKETSDLSLGETRVNTGDEQVGAWVNSAIILGRATIVLWRATGRSKYEA